MTKTKMSKRHLLWIFSLFFLVCFLLTILVVLLISGDSVALFSSFSDTITLSFSAEETQNSSLQENLGLMIEDIRAAQILKGANHQYQPQGSPPPNAWSRIIENYLKEGGADTNRFGFTNPLSNSGKVINYNTLELNQTDWNPAVFIADGVDFNFDSIPNPPLTEEHANYARLWGSMIIYKSFGRHEPIFYFLIGEDGVKGELNSFQFP
jgi:hypothetical protein